MMRPPRKDSTGSEGAWLTPGRLLALIAVVVGAYAAIAIVRALQGLLVMLLTALFLSFAIEPAVQWLSRHGWRRGVATAAVFASILLIFVASIALVVQPLVEQLTALVQNAPTSIQELNELLPFGLEVESSPAFQARLEEVGRELRNIAFGAAGNVLGIGATAIGAVFQLLSITLVTFYLVVDGPRVRAVLARPLPPQRQRVLLKVWELAVAKTGGYIYSRVLLAVASGLAHGLFLAIIGVPYPGALAVWMGITSAFIPTVGIYLGGILLLLVALIDRPVNGLWVGIFILAYQQVENYVLAPKVQSRTMDIHPAVAFMSVLVGATLLGAVGALLALPAAAIIQALLSTYMHRNELIEELRPEEAPEEAAEAAPVGGRPLHGDQAVRD